MSKTIPARISRSSTFIALIRNHVQRQVVRKTQATYVQNVSLNNKSSSTFSHSFIRRRAFSTEPSITSEEQLGSNLKARSHQWLQIPVGSWTRKDLSLGRSLFDLWFTTSGKKYDRVTWSSRLWSRWLEEYKAKNPIVRGEEILGMLHRVLHARKMLQSKESSYIATNLLQRIHDASDDSNDPTITPCDKTYSMVFEIMGQNPERPHACDIAEDLLSQRLAQTSRPVPDVVVWNSYLYLLSKCSRYQHDAPERAEAILRQMSPNEKSWASVMHAWAKSSRPEAPQRAQAILDRARKQGSVNSVCYNVCIDAWGQRGHGQEAEELLRHMIQAADESIRPDQFSFLAAINGWSKSQDSQAPERVETLLELMQNLHDGGDPDLRLSTEIFTSVLDTWARVSDSGPKVQEMLERMEYLNEKGDGHAVRLSEKAYTAAISAWANTDTKEAPERAVALLGRMEELGRAGRTDLLPGVVSFSAAIQAWSKSKCLDAPDQALSLLRHMKRLARSGRTSAAPNTITYNTLISAFTKQGLVQEAHQLLDEMNGLSQNGDHSVRPDAITYGTLLHGYAQSGVDDVGERAHQLVEEMEELYRGGNDLVKPSADIYTSLVLACGSGTNIDSSQQAENVLWRMHERFALKESDVSPTTDVCNALLYVFSQSGEAMAPEKAQSIVSWMEEQERGGNPLLRPNTSTYNYVMKSWASSKRRRAAEHIESVIRVMHEGASCRPNIVSYNHLLTAIRNSNPLGSATRSLAVLENLKDACTDRQSDLCPNLRSFHLIFETCLLARTSERLEGFTTLKSASQSLFNNPSLQPLSSTYLLILRAHKRLGFDDSAFVVEVIDRCIADEDVDNDVVVALRAAVS